MNDVGNVVACVGIASFVYCWTVLYSRRGTWLSIALFALGVILMGGR